MKRLIDTIKAKTAVGYRIASSDRDVQATGRGLGLVAAATFGRMDGVARFVWIETAWNNPDAAGQNLIHAITAPVVEQAGRRLWVLRGLLYRVVFEVVEDAALLRIWREWLDYEAERGDSFDTAIKRAQEMLTFQPIEPPTKGKP